MREQAEQFEQGGFAAALLGRDHADVRGHVAQGEGVGVHDPEGEGFGGHIWEDDEAPDDVSEVPEEDGGGVGRREG